MHFHQLRRNDHTYGIEPLPKRKGPGIFQTLHPPYFEWMASRKAVSNLMAS